MKAVTKYEVLSELVKRLNGEPSDELNTCPAYIEAELTHDDKETKINLYNRYEINKKTWCNWCKGNFSFLYDPLTVEYNNEKCISSCPCCTAKNPWDVINRLNEIIEEWLSADRLQLLADRQEHFGIDDILNQLMGA
jgi:hypothetical protein